MKSNLIFQWTLDSPTRLLWWSGSVPPNGVRGKAETRLWAHPRKPNCFLKWSKQQSNKKKSNVLTLEKYTKKVLMYSSHPGDHISSHGKSCDMIASQLQDIFCLLHMVIWLLSFQWNLPEVSEYLFGLRKIQLSSLLPRCIVSESARMKHQPQQV